MVKIPSGSLIFKTTNGDDFIPYPKYNQGKTYEISALYMDKYPVTNKQFKAFVDATNYEPKDKANFLKNWTDGKIPVKQENYPVVYISYEDAQAYAKWAGKRLPTEIEWQYAAQTSSGNEWPWVQKTPIQRGQEVITETLTVSSIEGINPKYYNFGDGEPYAVGKYPKGANLYGLEDLVGCVWQLTNDCYASGSYRYIMMKGGSYFRPSSSWWYVQGGPRELHYRQYLLRVSEGFERNATVGFRCVADVD
jgi:formylglycine-generating enzyme required for sulfatase activity